MLSNPISVYVEEGRAALVPAGEHEAYTAPKIARQLAALLDEGVPVVVDLRRTTFLDSTVVGVLLAAQERAERRGVELVLRLGAGTGPEVRRLFELTGLERRFRILDPVR